MNLASTKTGGRGSQARVNEKEIMVIGDVINKGKQQFWGPKNVHYHHGL
jgi:hypothetical protein